MGNEGMEHEPVLLDEALSFLKEALAGRNSPRLLDGTLGLGGYSEAMLRAFPGASVLGIDRDGEALGLAEERLRPFGERFRAERMNFGALGRLAGEAFDGFTFDLGVSNLQLTEGERGFSFQRDGPLDMRMDPEGDAPTAAEVLARMDVREMTKLLWDYGEERQARRIALGIEAHRRRRGGPTTTGELVDLIREVLPAPVQRRMGGHPARRVFQALRIYVNDELGELEAMLAALPALAAKGCVAVIVSYHSLEDRIVKRQFRAWEGEGLGLGKVLTRHPVLPGEEERERNYKSRSAKLRAFRFGIED